MREQPGRSIPAVVLILAAASVAGSLQAASLQVDPATARARESTIERSLVERLGPDAASIRAVVAGSRVTLIGEVEQRVTAELSAEVTMSLDGVRGVSNRVHARRDLELLDGKLFLEGKDTELEIQVKRAIWREVGETTARALEIEACDGVVSLRGVAPDGIRRSQALASAAQVPGVRSVLDLVRASS